MSSLLAADLQDPTCVLGPTVVQHEGRQLLAVRAFSPESQQGWVLDESHGVSRPMRKIHPAGLFEAFCPLPSQQSEPQYQLRFANQGGEMTTQHDPYSFEPMLSPFDLHLFGQGRLLKAYESFGAQLREVKGVKGVNFAVWAPNAQSISVVGDFNSWDARRHLMRRRESSGVWELFVPGLKAGEKYKYRVKTKWGEVIDKSDPFGFAAELPPCTASIVTDLTQHQWKDQDWMARRAAANPLEKPLSVYECHLGSWRRDPPTSNCCR
jgi:1,4-alpha-glucan branching enzyme